MAPAFDFSDDLDFAGIPAAVPQTQQLPTTLVVSSQESAQDGSYQRLVELLSPQGKVEMQMVDRIVEGGTSSLLFPVRTSSVRGDGRLPEREGGEQLSTALGLPLKGLEGSLEATGRSLASLKSVADLLVLLSYHLIPSQPPSSPLFSTSTWPSSSPPTSSPAPSSPSSSRPWHREDRWKFGARRRRVRRC